MRTPAALILAALIATPVLAGQESPREPLVFVPVPPVWPSVRPVDAGADRIIVDPRLTVLPVPSRPVVRLPRNDPTVVAVGPDRDGEVVRPGGTASARGVASWYCGNGSPCTRGYPGGLYAAAGPALRVGDWRGRYVVVSANGRSVRVRLVDWCQCYGARVLDLYRDAFSRLADPSAGLVKVTVTWN